MENTKATKDTNRMSLIGRLAAAVILIVAGVVCWSASGVADELAAQHERRATLQADTAAPSTRWRDVMSRAVDAGIVGEASNETQGEYWHHRYETLTDDTDQDDNPAHLLIVAHALFRKMERDGARTSGPERLDQVLQAYASVLKNAGFNHDAAYNYEFVSRLRDTVARSKGATSARAFPAAPLPSDRDDLPRGPTIHGRPGTHPPPGRGDEFEVLTPMDYGEREAQPEPTPGRRLPRKG